ncbi:hypothetical protein OR214_03270 [Ralstonia pickettii OR214]|jgi:hypothetical protein|uniref:Uncharacterized protein n=1 Tax=Ralstonia pickettii OR214 TaxID=1264675 RepID=R0E4X6_RALPI|nr:hypothetical protein OR214_03270 [Ralstonia pickettii OR214]
MRLPQNAKARRLSQKLKAGKPEPVEVNSSPETLQMPDDV